MIRFTEAMESVGKAWVNGADRFFSKLDPDPWKVAHEELEEAMKSSDSRLQELSVEMFQSKCLELLGIYRRILELQQKKPTTEARIADAFYRGFHAELEEPLPESKEVRDAQEKKFFN